MSRDWLRHSTVDRRTLRPLSMLHFDPSQQPCCPTRILLSVQQTCNTEQRRNTSNQSSARTHDSIHMSRRRAETERKGKTSCRGDFSRRSEWGGASESCMTITLIFVTHPLCTLLDLHLPPAPLTPLLTHFGVSTEAGMSSRSPPLPLSHTGLLRSPANGVAVERVLHCS